MQLTAKSLHEWADEMSRLTAGLMRGFEEHHGYAPGDNVVVTVGADLVDDDIRALAAAGAHDDLLLFHRHIAEVRLPDVDNGYFVHPARSTVQAIRDQARPTLLTGSTNDTVVVFGSDGGGALLALNGRGDRVYRLHDGALVGTSYDVDDPAAVVAPDLWTMLRQLRDATAAAVPGV